MPGIHLSATARVVLPTPNKYLDKLTDYFAEHGRVTKSDNAGSIELSFGRATIEADNQSLLFTAEGEDETGLAYMKYAIANHVLEFARNDNPKIVWIGDGAAGSIPPFFREMRVVSVRNITPGMQRVTLRGRDLHRFERGGLHVHLLFPPACIDEPQWPVIGEDGRPVWPEGDFKLISRVYTIRNIDAKRGLVDIDIVLHDGTPGSIWAQNAQEGEPVGMTGPGGGDAGEADWYLLAGDDTAIPAIGRILERLPKHAKAVVRIEVDSHAYEQHLPARCAVDLVWLHRRGRESSTTTLLPDAVKAVHLPEDRSRVFVWSGCEFAAFKAIRHYVRKDLQLRREQHLVVSYWKQGFEG